MKRYEHKRVVFTQRTSDLRLEDQVKYNEQNDAMLEHLGRLGWRIVSDTGIRIFLVREVDNDGKPC